MGRLHPSKLESFNKTTPILLSIMKAILALVLFSLMTWYAEGFCYCAACARVQCGSGTQRGRRDTRNQDELNFENAMTFNAIDTNGNLEIDLKEALELDSFEMDANKDGFIETEEFDPDLNDDIVTQYMNQDNQ